MMRLGRVGNSRPVMLMVLLLKVVELDEGS